MTEERNQDKEAMMGSKKELARKYISSGWSSKRCPRCRGPLKEFRCKCGSFEIRCETPKCPYISFLKTWDGVGEGS